MGQHHHHVPDLDEINKAAGRNLPAAIVVGVGLAAVVVLTLVYWNWGFVLLVGVLMTLGTIELHHALKTVGMTSARLPIAVGTFAIVIGSYIAGLSADTASWVVLLGALLLTMVVALIWRMPGGAQGFVRDAAASLFVIGYVSFLGSFVTLLLASPNGAARLITTLLLIMASDTGGYIAGVLFGKHHMAPRISPKKTWEGMAGSVLLTLAVGIPLAVFVLHAAWWVGLVLAMALVAFGTIGDLIESLVKRDVGIKDMSSFLPGHGGVMDRLDSMIIGVPVAWLLLLVLPVG